MTKYLPSSSTRDELDEIQTGPLSPIENQQLRRIIREYQYARYVRHKIGWWVVFGLGIPAALVACDNFFRDVLHMFTLK